MHLKYECSHANTTYIFYVGDFLNCIALGGGSNNLYRMFSSIRLKKIVLRGISSAVNKITTASVVWTGTGDSSREFTASGSTESPFVLTVRPAANSLTRLWKSTATDVLYSVVLNADIGECQMDVYFDTILWDYDAAHVQTGLTAAGTGGSLYTPALDNTTDGTTWKGTPYWIPVNRVTIV